MATNDQPIAWRELKRFDDVTLARSVAVSIAAMEFPVRTVHTRSGQVIEWADDQALDAADAPGEISVEVHPDNWSDLQDVLPSLIDEQVSFDQRLDQRYGLAARLQGLVLPALILIMVVLGALRLLKL